MKKYNELGSKDRANYWALMHLIDIASLHKENKEISFIDDPDYKAMLHALHILTDNLELEMFSDDLPVVPADELKNIETRCKSCSEKKDQEELVEV